MSEKTGLHDFISFNKLISKTLIMVVYVVGSLAITVAGVLNILPRSERIPYLGEVAHTSNFRILLGLGIIVIGNLLWRIACEAGVVIFSIQEDVSKIRHQLVDERKTDRSA